MHAAGLIFAGVSGSPGSVHALHCAVDLAHQHEAILVPLLAWSPPGGGLADRKNPDPQLRQLRKDDAWQRLHETIGAAFGGFPHGVRTWPLVLRGPVGQVLVSGPPPLPAACWAVGLGEGARRCGSPAAG